MNYSELEGKVREATNNEPWGASSELMQELARATNTIKGLDQVIGMIIKRLTEPKSCQWRPIYKSFLLIEYLLKHGSEQVKEYLLLHMTFLKTFSNDSYDIDDENGRSHGITIRTRADKVLNLLENDQELNLERTIAQENLHKYRGHGNQSMSSSGCNNNDHERDYHYIDCDKVPRISHDYDIDDVCDSTVSNEYYIRDPSPGNFSKSVNSSTNRASLNSQKASGFAKKENMDDAFLINFD